MTVITANALENTLSELNLFTHKISNSDERRKRGHVRELRARTRAHVRREASILSWALFRSPAHRTSPEDAARYYVNAGWLLFAFFSACPPARRLRTAFPLSSSAERPLFPPCIDVFASHSSPSHAGAPSAAHRTPRAPEKRSNFLKFLKTRPSWTKKRLETKLSSIRFRKIFPRLHAVYN